MCWSHDVITELPGLEAAFKRSLNLSSADASLCTNWSRKYIFIKKNEEEEETWNSCHKRCKTTRGGPERNPPVAALAQPGCVVMARVTAERRV